MMRQYELVERVLAYDPDANEALLNRAYVYAMRAHNNQKRASGAPYFSHPLEVAAILTDMKLDDATIATALLHDVIEDTDTTKAEIDTMFGPEIGRLVEGLTKIKRLDLVTKQAEQAENFRKLLLAISSDIRVLLVKLADRLHNMRTLEHVRADKRARISEETLEIYAPLAGRMGMQELRDELEDHAFRWMHTDAYATVTARLTALREKNRGLIEEINGALASKLAAAGIVAEVDGREKKPYAIWRKMERKQISLEMLSDIYAFRLICGSLDDCYRALGIVHASWSLVPGRFKDYISTPKPNDYQSIHTTVIGPRHQRVELQIRTRPMHEIAEYGVAAHVLYKEGLTQGVTDSNGQGAYQWLRKLVETLIEGDNPEEFLEHTKLELFQDQVFCFTPKGRLIAMPRGATPIDFAYAIHTDVGNHCVGAKINGRHLPLLSELKNGDEVEIQTSPAQTPPAAWLSIAATGKARSAIRRASKDALRRQYGELGRQLLTTAFRAVNRDYADDILARGLHRLSQKSVDDVLVAVGRGELETGPVVRATFPDVDVAAPKQPARLRRNRYEGKSEEGWFNLTKAIGLKFRWPGATNGIISDATNPGSLPIRGLKGDLPVEYGEGGAVPGDRIVGILTPGNKLKIFPIHSPKLHEFDNDTVQWIDVTWDVSDQGTERYPAIIDVTVLNQPGILAQVASVIGEADGNIDNLKMLARAGDFTKMRIELEVWDLAHLNDIMNGLRQKPVVSAVERVFSSDRSQA